MDFLIFGLVTLFLVFSTNFILYLWTKKKLNTKKEIWFTELSTDERASIEKLKYERELVKVELIREQESLKNYLENQRKLVDQDIEMLRKEKIAELTSLLASTEMEQRNFLKTSFEMYEQQIQTDKELLGKELEQIMNSLADLKSKQNNTLELIKEEERIKTEEDFYRLILNSADIEDVHELKAIEKRLNNKDILRKLIYKTYIETPMNLLFSRVGIKEVSGIYKITNVKNKMSYIGQSTNVKNRVKAHIQASLGISTIASQLVHDKMAEEGLENFTFQLVEECSREQLNSREKYWIEYFDSSNWGYNRNQGNK